MSNHIDEIVEYINKIVNVKIHSTALIIGSGFSDFLNRVVKSIPLQIASERDLFELKLLKHQHYSLKQHNV